jgi:hypothetical protein
MSNLQAVAGLIGVILRLPEFHAPFVEREYAFGEDPSGLA